MKLFPDRIGRLEFLLRYVVLLGCGAGNMILCWLADEDANGVLRMSLYVAIFVVGISIFIFAFRALLLPRLRDIGLSKAYALLIFVPLINLVFLLALMFVPANAFTGAAKSAR